MYTYVYTHANVCMCIHTETENLCENIEQTKVSKCHVSVGRSLLTLYPKINSLCILHPENTIYSITESAETDKIPEPENGESDIKITKLMPIPNQSIFQKSHLLCFLKDTVNQMTLYYLKHNQILLPKLRKYENRKVFNETRNLGSTG